VLTQVFLANHAGDIIVCVLVVLVIKIAVVSLGMRALGFSTRASVLGGLSLAQISELSLFLVARAQEYRLISRHVYLMVVATTIVLLVLTPLSAHAFRGIDRSEYRAVVARSAFSKWWNSINGNMEGASMLPVGAKSLDDEVSDDSI
jgi:predicted Kef-type K+ transport protein